MDWMRDGAAESQPRSRAGWPACNLFRHRLIPDLFCAVPQDCPVPGFIEGSAWAFAGTVRAETLASTGLDWSGVAAANMRRSGFQMFQSSPPKPRTSSDLRFDLWNALVQPIRGEPVQRFGQTPGSGNGTC